MSRAAAFATALALAAPAWAELPDHPAIARAPVPAWVAPAGPLRPAPAGASALAYRQVDDQVLAEGDASARYLLRVVEVVSQQGLEEAAQWEVDFDPAVQRVRVHGLDVFREGAWSDRLASSRASVLQREPELSRRVYDETLTLLLVLEDVRVGDLVRFSYTLEGFNPILGDRYAGSFPLGWSEPVAEQRLRVLSAADRPVAWRHLGEGELPPPHRGAVGGRIALTWHREDLPAIEPEPDLPDEWLAFPAVQLSQFASWAEVAAWGRALYPERRTPPQLAEVAARLAAAHPGDPEARLVGAVRWVQDEVRYFAVALGPHSHAPHEVADVARRRYGDCKDKSRLLVALLGALGIDAWPAFVHTSFAGEIARWHPSPFAFDHVVVVAEVAGRNVWIDATAELQGGRAGELYFPPYGVALELRPGSHGLTEIPAWPTRPGATTVRYDYRLGDVGEPFEVDIETVHERAGADRLRRRLAAAGATRLQEEYVDFYTDGERTVEPREPLEIVDDRDANRLVILERYRVLGCWQRSGDQLRCDLLPLTLASELIEPANLERRAPLRLPADLVTRETVAIAAAHPWDFAPVEVAQRTPWFDFTVASTPRDRGIELIYELATRSRRVEPSGIAGYSRALREVLDSTGYSLTFDQPLEGGPEVVAKDPKDRLYLVIGCAVMLAVPLLLALAGGGIYLYYRRSRRREAQASVATPAGAPTPARSPVPARAHSSGDGKLAVVLVAVVGGGFVLVALLGIVAAILVPNFLDALGKAKQKRTLADLSRLATGLEAYREVAFTYPEVETAEELAKALASASALADPPAVDGWKREWRYACRDTSGEAPGCDDYRIVSSAADAVFERDDPWSYDSTVTDRTDVDRDLVMGPEGLIQGPGLD